MRIANTPTLILTKTYSKIYVRFLHILCEVFVNKHNEKGIFVKSMLAVHVPVTKYLFFNVKHNIENFLF